MRVGGALAVVCLLALDLPEAAGKRSRAQKQANSRKRECERDVCGGVHEDDRTNCVLKCQSETCYAEVYGQEELEPGEIDTKRQREFSQCQSREVREAKRNRGKGRPVASSGADGAQQATQEPSDDATQEPSEEDSRADADSQPDGDAYEQSEWDAPPSDGDADVQVEL